MTYDKIDELYDALKKDGAVSKSRENFRSKMLASGKEGYVNRKKLFDALKSDGAVSSASYEEFGRRLGIHAVNKQNKIAQGKPVHDWMGPLSPTPSTIKRPTDYAAPISQQQDDTFIGIKQAQGLPQGQYTEADVQGVNDRQEQREIDRQKAKANDTSNKAYAKAEKKNKDLKPTWWQNALHILSDASQGAGPIESQSHYDSAITNDKDVRAAASTKAQLNKAQEALTEDKILRKSDDSNVLKYVANRATRIGRGLVNAAINPKTWDNGVLEMKDSGALLAAADAYDKNEATPAQQALLDAAAFNTKIQNEHGDALTGMYGAGATTVQMIPFMAQMAMNPGTGIGKAAMNGMGKYVTKKLGKSLAEKAIGKIITSAAKGAARVAGDTIEGAIANTAFGLPTTFADAADRKTGTVMPAQDENGHVVYSGQRAGAEKSAEKALGKAFVNNTLEYQSELVGEYFKPVGQLIGGVTGKGLEKIGLGKVNNWLTGLSNKQFVKAYQDFADKTKWNGTFGEYGEEVVNNVENAATVGDMNFNSPDDPNSVFNKKTNIDTFLGVALAGGFMSAVKTGTYLRNKYKAGKALGDADTKAATVLGADTWNNTKASIDDADDKNIVSVLTEAAKGKTPEQARSIMRYAGMMYAYRGANLAQMKDAAEGNGKSAIEQGYDKGRSLTDGNDMVDANNDYKHKRDAAATALGSDENIDAVFANGATSEAMLDRMKNSGAYTDEQIKAAEDYANAKSVYDGMIDNVRDKIDSSIKESDAKIESRVNKADGMIHPATMIDNDRKVYVISGNVTLSEDGDIDDFNSDDYVIVADAETGEMEMTPPSFLKSADAPINAEQEKQEAADNITDTMAQEASDKIDGVLSFSRGDIYAVTGADGNQHSLQVLTDTGDGNVQVVSDGTDTVVLPKKLIQQLVDANNLARLQQKQMAGEADNGNGVGETGNAGETGVETNGPAYNYNLNDEIAIYDENGNIVRGSVTANENDDELIQVRTESRINGKLVNVFTREELDAINANNEEIAQETPVSVQNPQEIVQEEPVLAQNEKNEVNLPQSEKQPMPMVGEGENAEPDFYNVEPKRARDYIYEETGLSRDEANGFVKANEEASAKALDKAKKSQPKIGTSISKYNKEKTEWQKKVDEAQRVADYWKNVKDAQRSVYSQEGSVRQQKQAETTEKAIEEDKQFRAEQAKKADEQALIGTNNVSPAIRDKWNNAPKIDGAADEIVLPNGEKVAGHYILAESGAASPSHNATAEFAKTDGFPIDDNDQSVNDRDYERDQDAQTITRGMAGNYDSRAMQTPVVVSNDGVVLSGNGRTMAGELAARDNTDGAYIEHLKKYPQKYGFTEEQVAGMQHPRVLFVPDDAMPYTSDTFSKFNQQEMKGQSKKEHAVKMGKIVDDATYNRIIRSINRYDTLGEFYADTSASTEAISDLQKAGAISSAQMAEMFDGDTISSQAKELLENVLIGKAFEGNPDAIRQITEYKSMRQSIITALGEISNNQLLGEDYNLEDELAAAIDIVYHARNSGIKSGEPASFYARQGNLFQLDDGATVADYTNATVMMLADIINDNRVTLLKKYLALYNERAKMSAIGQIDMFTGTVESKKDIIQSVNNFFKNATNSEQQEAIDKAVEQRKAESVQQNGDSDSVDERPEETGKSETAEAIAEAEQSTETNPTDAQKEAGNYKKGHVQIGSFDITVENPKVSERSGKDANGNPWSITMQNTYGYIRGTEGVDGDHIDVFLSDDFDAWNGSRIFVVDQYNEDGTFDEHKVMLGFNDIDEAESAYYANYSTDWKERHPANMVTAVNAEDFEKWIDSSKRKTKAFADYANVKTDHIPDATKMVDKKDVGVSKTETTTSSKKNKGLKGTVSENNANFADNNQENGNNKETDQGAPVLQRDSQKELGSDHEVTGGTRPEVDQLERRVAQAQRDARSIEEIENEARTFAKANGLWIPYSDIMEHTPFQSGNESDNYIDEEHGLLYKVNNLMHSKGSLADNFVRVKLYNELFPETKLTFVGLTSIYEKGAVYPVYTQEFVNDATFASEDEIRQYMHERGFEPTRKEAAYSNGEYTVSDLRPRNVLKDANGRICVIDADVAEKKNSVLDNTTDTVETQKGNGNDTATPENAVSSEKKDTKLSDKEEIKSEKNAGFSIDKRFHKKNGTYIYAVNFTERVDKEAFKELKSRVKDFGGYYSSFGKGGFIFDSEEDSKKFADAVMDKSGESIEDSRPLSLQDVQKATGEVESNQVKEEKEEKEDLFQKAERISKEHTTEEKPKNEGALGLVSDERMAELKERLRKKLGGQLNVGIDPEILAIGMELAAGHIDRGVRKFADFAKVMVDDLGDVIRPYLKAFYNGARDLPEITDNGLSAEMTPYDDVRTFDVANFDKETPNVIAKAEEITNEVVIDEQASTARNELTNNRNQNRRKENEQTTADTEAITSETEIVASKAESDIKTSTEENQLNEVVVTIDKQVETVNKQLALLGYYEADENSPFDESYGYMRSAEKKAVKDADTLAKRLVEELGIDLETIVDKKGKKRKNIATANIAPAGGEVSIRLPLTAERDLYINISLEPDYESGSVHSDNLNIDHIYFRIENPEDSGYNQYVGRNVWIGKDSTYQELIKNINSEITSLVPDFNPTNESVSQSAKKTSKTDKSKKKVVSSQQTTDDLFGGLFDNINDNNIDNGQKETNRASQTVVSKQSDSSLGIDEARTDGGIRSSGTEQPVGERNSGNRTGGDGRGNEDGSRSDEETGRHESARNQRDTKKRTSGEVRLSDGTAVQHGRTDRQSDEQSKTDGGREGVSKGESSTVTGSGTVSKKKASKPQPKFTNNYVYPEDASEIDNYTKSQRLAANVKALEVLRNLLLDGRQATDEEREILGRFRGWGGVELGRSYSTNMMRLESNSYIQALADIIDEFDPQGKKGILESINRAALSSYYTPTPIAKGINRFLELAGYNGGNMLDPSMGNGIFEGTMPVGIQQRTAISGIELDWLTGQIAQHLYPDANVRINGFEAANVAPNSFDVVESNIPFGNFGVNDKDWKNDNTPVRKSAQARIHNYFAVKMIEATKAGGLCTIMTSNAILDTKGNQIIRDYIADQCEILGVVRLPDNTFKGAGTGVVTDVIFLRKYKDEADRNGTHSNGNYVEKIESPFLHTAETELINKSEGKSYKVSHNGYFASNPQMIIGEQEAGGQYRKDQYGLTSNLTTDEIGEKLNSIIEKDIVGKRKGKLFNTSKDTRETYQAVRESYTGDGDYVSNGNLVEQNGKYGILEAERGKYGDVTRTFTELPNLRSKADRINAMLPLRNAMKRLISEEINGSGNETLDAIRKELKEAYDGYVKKFGKLGEKDNDYLEVDIDGFGIRALEKWKGGKYLGLSDIFTKNTIKPALDITQAKTPTDAISVCLSEYGEIRSDFMENVLGESWQEQCGDALFKVPFMPDTFETKDSYLSGDVKTKLNDAKKAAEQDDTYKDNVKALEEVQPKEIGFTDINIRMGARWVPVDIYSDFLKEMFGIANWRDKSGVAYSPEADVFTVNINPGELGGRSEEWKTERRSASEVFEAALKDKTLNVWDTVKDGNSETKVVNKEQTELVNGKIQDLRMAFEDWLPRDNERVQKLTSIYNDMFNRTVLRKFDGSHLNVPGLMGIELRPHQKDAVWMLINNRGGIVDHIVGAGKTLVMQSAIMEMRRMGIAKKPMIVALKSTVAQIAKEFKEAYPAARVLSPSEKDFQKTNRKKFLSNIALNDYDCVVLSHEQYCMLAHSEEVETQVINEQLAQLDNAIEFLYGQDDKSNLTKKQIKGLEKRKANLEAKLGKLLDRKVDREFTFENLGIDYLFVDECQAFKSLPYVTSYQNIAGLGDAKGSEKAVALLNGIRYLQKLHQGDMGTVFLSGTTITNSLVEIYNLMQYLRPREMGRLGLNTFDAWASQFAVRSSELEYGVTNELKEKNRFRNFDNVPELAKMYAEIADVRNDLNLKLPKPKPQMHIVTVPESDSLSEINSAVVGMVKNKDGSYFGLTTNERSPFGLLASTISAKAAISTKLIDPDLDDSEGKVKYVCENVKKIYDKFAKQKGTQLIFCDTGVPVKGKPYDAYTDIINRLVNEYGIPREEIVDIHVADTDVKRKALFAKVNEGKVRILIGGTKNMGTGVNVQKRITAMHHVDVPWTPADREQREGRGVRQGNEIARDFNGNNVDIFFYATEGSLDMYKYQLQDTKGKMFAQFKSGTVGERNFDEGNADESGGFDPAEIVALLSGNPVIFEKSKQDKLVEKLRRAKRAYESDWQRRKSKFDELTERKTKYDRLVQMNARDIEALERGGFAPDENGTYPSNVTISVVGNYGYESQKTFDKPKEAGAYIHKLLAQGKKVAYKSFRVLKSL